MEKQNKNIHRNNIKRRRTHTVNEPKTDNECLLMAAVSYPWFLIFSSTIFTMSTYYMKDNQNEIIFSSKPAPPTVSTTLVKDNSAPSCLNPKLYNPPYLLSPAPHINPLENYPGSTNPNQSST